MPRVLTEKVVRRAIIKFLERKGWARNLKEKETHEFGVDIRVRHNNYSRYFLIETKGEGSTRSKSRRQQLETHFVYGLGQLVTRMKTGATRSYYGLGLPEQSAKIALRRLPWQVAKKLLLYVFSVDGNGKVKLYDWRKLKGFQKKS